MVAVARDLANETGGAAFTVVQVAQRAGFSLKVFYRYFASKDELLLALIEEDSRLGADLLVDQLVGIGGPVERLRSYVEGLFGLLTIPGRWATPESWSGNTAASPSRIPTSYGWPWRPLSACS